MANLVERTFYRLGERLPGRVSTPSEDGYAAATANWSKPVDRMLRAVVHCGTTDEASPAICAAVTAVFRSRPAPAATIARAGLR
jgi:hypothetical protein